jgi:hypothetical protein
MFYPKKDNYNISTNSNINTNYNDNDNNNDNLDNDSLHSRDALIDIDIIKQTNDLDEISKTLKTGDILLCDNLQQKGLGLFGWLIKYATKSDFSHAAMIVIDPEFTNPPMKGVYVWQSGTADIPDAEDGIRKIGVQLTPFLEFVHNYYGKIYLRRLHISIHDNTSDENIFIHNNVNNNDNNTNDNLHKSRYIPSTKRFVSFINPINILKNTLSYVYNGYNLITRNIYNLYNPNHYLSLPYTSQSLTPLSSSSTSSLPLLSQNNTRVHQLQYHISNPFTNEKLQEIHKIVYNKPYDIIIRDWIEAYFQNDPHPQKISRFWCSALVAFIYTKVGLFDSSLDWSIIRPSFFSSENPDLNNKYLIGAYFSNEILIWCSSGAIMSV